MRDQASASPGRRRRGHWVLALAVALTTVAAQAKPVSYTDLLARPRPTPAAVIHYGPAKEQYGELFLPARKGPHPVIVLIHGGCWLEELPGPELMDQIAGDLQARGFAVWNIDYRRVGGAGGGYPGTFEDTGSAIDYLRMLADKDALDLRHVVAVGHSAGGHLALWAAAREHLPKTSVLYRPDPLPLSGVVSLGGIADLETYRATGPDNCGGPATIDALIKPSSYADTSPAALLPLGVKQQIVSGSLDPIVPTRFAVDYTAKAKAKGDDVVTHDMPGAGHFELIDPKSSAWKEIEPLIAAMAQRAAQK